MEIIKVGVTKIVCSRCKHIWEPRKPMHEIRICPKCKSPYFDTPKKEKK